MRFYCSFIVSHIIIAIFNNVITYRMYSWAINQILLSVTIFASLDLQNKIIKIKRFCAPRRVYQSCFQYVSYFINQVHPFPVEVLGPSPQSSNRSLSASWKQPVKMHRLYHCYETLSAELVRRREKERCWFQKKGITNFEVWKHFDFVELNLEQTTIMQDV